MLFKKLVVSLSLITVVVTMVGCKGSGNKKGPDLKAMYNKYCKATWADYGSDGSYLYIDTNPDDVDDEGLAYPDAYYAIEDINKALGMPESLVKDMGRTTSKDGKQTETYGYVTVSWKYHPDTGLEVTYKVK